MSFEPGSPWENGSIESFHGKLRDELLDGEIFSTILDSKVPVAQWRRHYNTVGPYSSWATGHWRRSFIDNLLLVRLPNFRGGTDFGGRSPCGTLSCHPLRRCSPLT